MCRKWYLFPLLAFCANADASPGVAYSLPENVRVREVQPCTMTLSVPTTVSAPFVDAQNQPKRLGQVKVDCGAGARHYVMGVGLAAAGPWHDDLNITGSKGEVAHVIISGDQSSTGDLVIPGYTVSELAVASNGEFDLAFGAVSKTAETYPFYLIAGSYTD